MAACVRSFVVVTTIGCSSRKPVWIWILKVPGVKQPALEGLQWMSSLLILLETMMPASTTASCQQMLPSGPLQIENARVPLSLLWIHIFMWKTMLVSPEWVLLQQTWRHPPLSFPGHHRFWTLCQTFPLCYNGCQEQWLLEAPKMFLLLLSHTIFLEPVQIQRTIFRRMCIFIAKFQKCISVSKW